MSETEHILIQTSVERTDSIRAKLAELAWTEGISSFVTNGVPFSFSSGRVLAQGIAHIVDALARTGDIRVMELGAGIGYLSAFCLDTLKENFPDTYERSTFLVSDGEEALVRDAEGQGVLVRHGHRAEFTVAGLQDKDTILRSRPRILILSYLLDAIPPKHVEQRNGELKSARIETSIPADLSLLDGSEWPPRTLNADEVATRLWAPLSTMTPALARKIVPLLGETWSWVSEGELTTAGTILNSRQDVIRDLCSVLEEMPGESALIITDFGYVESDEIELNEMMTEYGLCAFWAVAFDEIREAADARGFETLLHRGEEGQTHTLVLYKGSREEEMADAFRHGFNGMMSDRPGLVLQTLEEDASLRDIQRAIAKMEQTMPEVDVHSYGNLSRFARVLLQYGDLEGAARLAEKCVALYPEVAAPEMSILGAAKGKAGDLDAAAVLFQKAIDVAPGHANGYLGLSGVYRAREDWDRYFSCMRTYLSMAECDVVKVVAGIATTLAGTNLAGIAAEAAGWVEANC